MNESSTRRAIYVSYLRVSTRRQGQSGLGLEAQRNAIHEYVAQREGLDALVAEFIEVETGKSAANRPELEKAIRRCELQSAMLLVAKLDRLSRNLRFITTIREEGIKFVCADNPEVNELTLNILGAIAQHERGMISGRTRAALAAAKARGVKLGNPNFGGIRNQDTELARTQIQRNADRFARNILPEIEKILGESISSLTEIATHLNNSRIGTRRGKNWTPMAVKRILKRTRVTETAYKSE
jgi:DNA invertase Pin-like site-specific DNA recombinase